MKILITGSTGFIGKNIKEYLENKEGYEIYAPASRELNCLDESAVKEYLEQHCFDYILHFALYNNGIDKTKDGTKVAEYNLRMYLNFAKYSNLYGKMFYAGSGAEYDKRFDIKSVKEEIGRTLPTDSYGLTKYTIGQLIENSTNIYSVCLMPQKCLKPLKNTDFMAAI